MEENRLPNEEKQALTVESSDCPEVSMEPCAQTSEETPGDDRTEFQKRVDRLSVKKWRMIQIIAGIVLGLAVIFFLFGGENEGFSMFTLYAALLALFVPRYAERSCGRSIGTGRMAMIITMAICLVVQVVLTSATEGFHFFAD